MTTKNVTARVARLAALLITAALIPACSILGSGSPGGILWNSSSTGSVAPGASTGGLLWTSPNQGVLEPIGIVGIGAIEVTYADVDPANYGPGTAGALEGPHPVSTDRVVDAMSEAVVDSAVQQLYNPNVGFLGNPNGLGGGGVVGNGPALSTGDQKLGAISRARAKHNALHDPNAAPDPGGVGQRCTWMSINPAFTNAQSVEFSGPGMLPAQAAPLIANAVVLNPAIDQFGATGFWTNGTVNFYVFTMIDLDAASGGP